MRPDDEPQALVRRFSEEVRDGLDEHSTVIESSLAEDLRAKEMQEEIQRIERGLAAQKVEDQLELDRSREDIKAAMKAFYASMSNSKDCHDFSTQPASWRDVIVLVEKQITEWEQEQNASRLGKAKSRLRKFCNTINDHKMALSMLPQGNEYVSLFTGALATILQASRIYTKMQEGLPDYLVKIYHCLTTVDQNLALFDSDNIRSLAWRLYGQIFRLLAATISWYNQKSRKRFKQSFNESLTEIFDAKMTEIQTTTDRINEQARYLTSAYVKIGNLRTESVELKINSTRDLTMRNREDLHKWMAQNEQKMNQQHRIWEDVRNLLHVYSRLQIGHATVCMLQDDAKNGRDAGRLQLTATKSDTGGPEGSKADESIYSHGNRSSSERGSSSTTDEIMPEFQLRSSVIADSAHLDKFFDHGQILPLENTEDIMTTTEAVSKMKDWATSVRSQLLCLCGTGHSLDLSNLAARYSTYAREGNVPIASYFCRLSAAEPPSSRTRETIEAVAFLYAIIRQLIELLPTELDPNGPDFDASRLLDLEGTMSSWRQALTLLEDLLSSIKHSVQVIVIDGFDVIDDGRSTTSRLRDFLEVLRRRVEASRGPMLKVLFTTPAESPALKEALHASEISFS